MIANAISEPFPNSEISFVPVVVSIGTALVGVVNHFRFSRLLILIYVTSYHAQPNLD